MSWQDENDRAGSTINKKRTRYEYTASSITPLSRSASAAVPSYMHHSTVSSSLDSPAPMMNSQYLLAGGLDTPGLADLRAQDLQETADARDDIDSRRNLGGKYFPVHGTPPSAGNGQNQAGIGKAALGLVGGVVGKVWEFCTTTVFKGFSAGGGQAYDAQGEISPFSAAKGMHEKQWQEDFSVDREHDRFSTPVPGEFPDEYSIRGRGDEYRRSPSRPAKRRQLETYDADADGEKAEKSWVMVEPVQAQSSQPQPLRPTQIRAPPRFSASSVGTSRRNTNVPASRATANTSLRRPAALRTSYASGVSRIDAYSTNAGNVASYASPRSPSSARSKIPTASHPAYPSHTVHYNGTHSPIRKGTLQRSSGSPTPQSPASREAQIAAERLQSRLLRDEREQDEAMRKFNQKLKAMIREGKEALGTKIQVVDGTGHGDTFEDGFVDE